MVDLGLSNLDARRAGTRDGADLMGRRRIAEGVVADILVVDADPTTEAAADRNRHRLRDETIVWLSTASGPYGTELEAIRIEVR